LAETPLLPRVAVNAMCLWRPFTGIGQYTLQIALEWARAGGPAADYFYGNGWSDRAAPRDAPGVGTFKRVVKALLPRPYETTRAVLQKAFDRRPPGAAVYFEPNFLPFRCELPLVLTVHDLSHLRHPETHPVERVRILDRLLPPALARAAHVLTVSNFQREEILSVFGLPPERVTAVHNGVSGEFHPRTAADCAPVLARHALSYREYFLAVGTLEPRKNLAAALEAYARLSGSLRARCPLVVAGMRGWKTESFAPRLRELAQSGAVRPLGFVDEAELPAIVAGARLLIYPSLYEGFGLPALEAMASGVPVIVAARSALPEVVGDAGVQVDPLDVDAMARAMEDLHGDEGHWQRRAAAGLERARSFSWSESARRTAQVLARAAGAPGA
jgi:alpha-1,3-rhamnosyl/mannosyltransferase